MINWALRISGIAFASYIAVAAQPGSSLFSYHPVLMVLTFTVLMTEAMLIFSKSGLAAGAHHGTKVTVHWIFLFLAGICHSLGFAAIYFNKELNEKPHFTSWHGTVGLIATALLILQLSIGVFAKYPKLLNFCMKIRTVKKNHAVFGMITYSCGTVALLLGLWSTWFTSNASLMVSYGAIALHIMLLIMMAKNITTKYILS